LTLAPVSPAEVFVAPPALYVSQVRESLDARYGVSGQNAYSVAKGAFTGEVAPEMLKDVGAGYVLVGHSERRNVFGESVEATGLKTVHALAAGLVVVFCCGELLTERESGKTREVRNINWWDAKSYKHILCHFFRVF